MQYNNPSQSYPRRMPAPYSSPGVTANATTGGQYSGPSSPPVVGSLGTPKMRLMGAASSGGEQRWRPAGGASGEMPATRDLTLVPTRPLLKALARECKPLPPWCVGAPMAETMAQELVLFASFLELSAIEKQRSQATLAQALRVVHAVWPEAALVPMGINAAGVTPPESMLHLFAEGSSEVPADVQVLLRQAGNAEGFQVEFSEDCRSCPTVILTEARTGDACAVRYGPLTALAKTAADVYRQGIAIREERRVALVAIDALLRQNKVVADFSNTNSGSLPSEVTVVMLLAIANSYEDEDIPEADRLLIDFFLTFGFSAHFDNATLSVVCQGMQVPTPKKHLDAQLSVIDPGDGTSNIATKANRVPHLLAVFNYCYTAITQYFQSAQNARRAQSALSTVIGGEAYWSRVLHLYHSHQEPFFSVVRAKQDMLAQHMQNASTQNKRSECG